MGQDLLEGFQEFTDRWAKPQANRPRVVLQRRGTVSLNRAAFRALKESSHIVFMHNASTGAIALKAVGDDVRHAAVLRKQKGSDSYLMSGKAFFESIQLPYGDDLLVWDDVVVGDGVLVLEPDKMHREPGRTASAHPAGASA